MYYTNLPCLIKPTKSYTNLPGSSSNLPCFIQTQLPCLIQTYHVLYKSTISSKNIPFLIQTYQVLYKPIMYSRHLPGSSTNLPCLIQTYHVFYKPNIFLTKFVLPNLSLPNLSLPICHYQKPPVKSVKPTRFFYKPTISYTNLPGSSTNLAYLLQTYHVFIKPTLSSTNLPGSSTNIPCFLQTYHVFY